MFTGLDVDLQPGTGLGMFEIGASLWSTLDLLRRHNALFPRVDIKYDAESPCASVVVLHLRPHVDLLFTGNHQRLRTIVLRQLRDPNPPVTLRYRDSILSSPQETLRKLNVSRLFGPTYAGDSLLYPGVAFTFDEDGIGDTLTTKTVDSDDRTKEVKRVIITQKAINQEKDALDEVEECPPLIGSIKLASIHTHKGVILHFHPSTSQPVHVNLGHTTAQDLTLALGPPLRTYFKEDDRMDIHASSKRPSEETSSYFFNYFQHGIDFLISGSDHCVQKVILHTNIPGSPMFQSYQRCPWELLGEPEDEEDDSPPRVHFYDKFDVITRFLSGSNRDVPHSMLLDRADDDMLTLAGSVTKLVGFDGVVLEVTETNYVAGITVF